MDKETDPCLSELTPQGQAVWRGCRYLSRYLCCHTDWKLILEAPTSPCAWAFKSCPFTAAGSQRVPVWPAVALPRCGDGRGFALRERWEHLQRHHLQESKWWMHPGRHAKINELHNPWLCPLFLSLITPQTRLICIKCLQQQTAHAETAYRTGV